MMHSILRNISILSLALIVGGCAGNSPPSRFYLLSAMAPTDAAPHSTTVVGVGPVRLPGYLERDQIVSRSNTNSLRVDEFEDRAQLCEGPEALGLRVLVEGDSHVDPSVVRDGSGVAHSRTARANGAGIYRESAIAERWS